MWCLVTSRGQRLPIRSFPAVLGRHPPADLLLPHESIAPAHARFSLTREGDPFILALDDAVVEVDGWRLEESTLHHGDQLLLGTVRLSLLNDQQPGRPDSSAEDHKRPEAHSAPLPRPQKPRPVTKKTNQPQTSKRRPATALRSQVSTHRPGFLHADLSQLGALQKLLIVAGLAAVGGAIAWALATMVPLLV
ncbi:MAG: hypothetical protein ACI9EF_000967 [Pseudohongiellaceae bacterium]|jgi:hypothetical protein